MFCMYYFRVGQAKLIVLRQMGNKSDKADT